MRTGLRKGIGFTLLIDPVVKDIGIVGAAVLGSVYRFSQMEANVCYASQRRIGENINLSREATNRWLNKLVESDYLRIGAKNYVLPNGSFTNLYLLTKKAGVENIAFDEGKPIPIPQNANSFLDMDFPDGN